MGSSTSNNATPAIPTTASLDQFQTQQQRHILDTVAQIRKCGLDGLLSLPQLVVVGDQSAGKSSVLEALTEINIPRADNLCTRFATEFTLRNALSESLRIRIIPDENRPKSEQTAIREFSETIIDFSGLPDVMEKAMAAMGLDSKSVIASTPPFSQDVLSIEIEGPTKPQLTLVDVPGLIQTDTKGITKEDRDMVAEITDFYIKQERTICLAVVSATNDYANQPILTKVRDVDPDGDRTLGIITKPDRLDSGSGSEAAFISLARNEDIFFKLGWHVVKNRKFEEMGVSIEARNASESTFFRNSNFKDLPAESRGINALRDRLSILLFDHTKRELPNLRKDLESALCETQTELKALGQKRANAQDCRNYLTSLSLICLDITKAAMAGHYEGEYFRFSVDETFSPKSANSIRRFRAVIQQLNHSFAETMRTKGSKYHITDGVQTDKPATKVPEIDCPTTMPWKEALDWVGRVMVRCRGREPYGNYNPLIIGELFWEQSSRWHKIAEEHVTAVSHVCEIFLDTLFAESCPKDVHSRLAALKITDALRTRQSNALEELQRLVDDNKDFPVTYNHYYTDLIQKAREERADLAAAYKPLPNGNTKHTFAIVNKAEQTNHLGEPTCAQLEHFSCEEALVSLLSMYETLEKVYVANVTNQVIERHMVRRLDKIFSPIYVNSLSDDDVMKVASESTAVMRKRTFLSDRLKKLKEGQDIFRKIMGSI